jgi:predicted transcriptional regulator
MNPIDIVDDLTQRARRAGLSMAEVCRRAGIAESTPSRWKAGTFEPRLSVLRKVEDVIAAEEKRLADEQALTAAKAA